MWPCNVEKQEVIGVETVTILPVNGDLDYSYYDPKPLPLIINGIY